METTIEILLPEQALLDSLPDAVVIVDRDGHILILNDKTQQLFGYTCEELLQQSVELLIPERFRIKHPGHRRSFFGDPDVRPMGAGLDLRAAQGWL